ncbi:MAG: hypothetical protein IJ551_09930 [Prevotella sp.]|nr:hypothetical protein [Prevotella sp.]
MKKNQFHIGTYIMPVGTTTWKTENIFTPSDNEEQVFNRWQGVVREVERDYPRARVRRTLARRTVEQALRDRESSICSREWVLPNGEGNYRVTMYITKK